MASERVKEYNRKRAAVLYQDFRERRDRLIYKLGGCCYLCSRSPKAGLHFHHLYYDPVESNYPRHSKSMSVRIKRLEEAEAHTQRFVLLCGTCHTTIEACKRLDKNHLLELL